MANDFLGEDCKIPLNGGFGHVDGLNTVNQDIQILLMTIPGERVMRPTYGCKLFTRLWDNIDVAANSGVQDIRDAITQWEPRVNLIQIEAQIARNEGIVKFTVTYVLKGQNTPQNLVFPFQANLRNT